jgi:hypothetical protein
VIRIIRSKEPASLEVARRTQLERIAQLAPGGDRSELLVGYKPDAVKTTLFTDQRKKCAWCEVRQGRSSNPVEHVRPKDGAWRDLPDEPRQRRPRDRATSPGHYWWLTWTWENLLFSCVRCNDQGHKANYFPLAPTTPELPEPTFATQVLPPEAFDASTESPLLLDPTEPDFDFLDHVRWQPSQTKLARRLWLWTPMPISPRGDATILILRLAELAEDVQAHLVRAVLPSIEEIERHLANDRRVEATARWRTLLDTTLAASEPFTAATWCGLDAWMGSQHRASGGLADPPRPSRLISP